MDALQKPLVWMRGEVKTPPFSKEARLESGILLRRLQNGERISLPASRPMPAIGSGCHELRVTDQDQTWRIIDFIDTEAIVILDVFAKKTRTTPKSVLDDCKRRLRAYRAL